MCSTTFGDFVCRGCKRWLHEVIDWNAYDDDRKIVVIERLHRQRAACVAGFVEIADVALLRAAAVRAGMNDEGPAPELLLALLRRNHAVLEIGCRTASTLDGRALYSALDAELLLRAQAGYEHSFRVLVR